MKILFNPLIDNLLCKGRVAMLQHKTHKNQARTNQISAFGSDVQRQCDTPSGCGLQGPAFGIWLQGPAFTLLLGSELQGPAIHIMGLLLYRTCRGFLRCAGITGGRGSMRSPPPLPAACACQVRFTCIARAGGPSASPGHAARRSRSCSPR